MELLEGIDDEIDRCDIAEEYLDQLEDSVLILTTRNRWSSRREADGHAERQPADRLRQARMRAHVEQATAGMNDDDFERWLAMAGE